jgi:phage gp36-like protein
LAYASSADMTARYDENVLKDLSSDDGTPAAQLATATAMTAALDDASGQIEAAVLVAQMYQVSDLTALTGNSLALLKQITCDIAMYRMLKRRPEKYGKELVEAKKYCDEYLEMLRQGKRVFNVAANIAAGLPTVDGPSARVYERLNLLPDRTRNYYPARGSRLPIGRQ